MSGYLLKTLVVLCVSLYIMYLYYFTAQGHSTSYEGTLGYLIFVGIFYAGYRLFIQHFTRKPESLSLNIDTLIGLFLFHLFVLCCYLFQASGAGMEGGFILFFKIIFFSAVPLLLFLVSYGFGDTVLQKIPEHKNQSKIFQILSGSGIGFFALITLVMLSGFLHFYNIFSVLIITSVFAIFGFGSLKRFFADIGSYRIQMENIPSKPSFLHITTSEFLFYVLTLLISVNLISIVRPFPIGWDDLGVYMNYPNLMSQAENLLSLGSMYNWQVFTGIGFMTGSNTQAFFFSSVGGMMALLALYLIFKDLFQSTKKTLLNIPLLLVTTFASMPMVVFQLSKDMKLDLGLMFVSSIALYILYYVLLHMGEDKKLGGSKKYYLCIAGILIGFAFTIKITSLLLISGVFAMLVYYYTGVKGFIGYIALYIAVFTKLGLWAYMNINYPSDSLAFVNGVSLIFGAIGIGAIFWAFFDVKKKIFQNALVSVMIVFIGFIGALSPWLVKNISEAGSVTISHLLSGKPNRLVLDYSLIHGDKELEKIIAERNAGMTSSGTTSNEDFGRYFGYEKGINNYLKLPINLSLQKNQKGEFTDITFLFLALLPIIFLFLPYRKTSYVYLTFGVCLLGFLGFFIPVSSDITTYMMSQLSLPLGYIAILAVFLLWLILNAIINPRKKLIRLFQINLVFALFYTFLWTLSAYGVVWYGIIMYLSFLLMIGVSLHYISCYKESDDFVKTEFKIFGSGILFLIFSVYFLMSAVPSSLKAIKNSGFINYKKTEITAHESLFDYRAGYLEAIYAMNVHSDKSQEFLRDSLKDDNLYQRIKNEDNLSILRLVNTLKAVSQNEKFSAQDRKSANEGIKEIYKNIISPKESYRNTANIFRAGTFLNYYIVQNDSRVVTDSLLNVYDTYVFDTQRTKTLDNFKKLGLEYILLDLNAATIDKDERRDLTRRYENMLQLLVSDDLQYIAGNSTCLVFALENYKKSQKQEADVKKFIETAGVNYESYDNGKQITRFRKLQLCHSEIVKKLNLDAETLLNQGYAFLVPFKNHLSTDAGKEIAKDQEKLRNFLKQNVPSGNFTLFKIKK